MTNTPNSTLKSVDSNVTEKVTTHPVTAETSEEVRKIFEGKRGFDAYKAIKEVYGDEDEVYWYAYNQIVSKRKLFSYELTKQITPEMILEEAKQMMEEIKRKEIKRKTGYDAYKAVKELYGDNDNLYFIAYNSLMAILGHERGRKEITLEMILAKANEMIEEEKKEKKVEEAKSSVSEVRGNKGGLSREEYIAKKLAELKAKFPQFADNEEMLISMIELHGGLIQ